MNIIITIVILLLLSSSIYSINILSSKSLNIEKIRTSKYNWELDQNAMISRSTFKIKPNDLIQRCKVVINNGIGLKEPNDLADDFQFIFPVVGPLSKDEYLKAVGGFSLDKMFPGFDKGLYYNFNVDPYEHNRVWFTASFRSVHSGDGPFGKATNKQVVCPPQSISLSFNDQGKVIKYTGGYVMDKTIGNSGGLGGVFGPLYAIGRGLPFPEARPWKKSWQYSIFTFIGSLASKFRK
jgi:hypothetical protein